MFYADATNPRPAIAKMFDIKNFDDLKEDVRRTGEVVNMRGLNAHSVRATLVSSEKVKGWGLIRYSIYSITGEKLLETDSEWILVISAISLGILHKKEFLHEKVQEIINSRLEDIKSQDGNFVLDRTLDFIHELSETDKIIEQYRGSIRHVEKRQ